MYINAGDLDTHIYPEIRDIITREDAELVQLAIGVGIDEAKSYLMRYDLVALFGTYDVQGQDDVAPTVDDKNLNSKVKDLICWQLIKLSNPNIDIALFQANYEYACKWFESVKKSQLAPAGWVYKTDDEATPFPEGNIINQVSNTPRNNHW